MKPLRYEWIRYTETLNLHLNGVSFPVTWKVIHYFVVEISEGKIVDREYRTSIGMN